MAREFAQQIATRDPGWQHEGLTRRGIFEPAFDAKMMPIGIGQLHGVPNQNVFLSRPVIALGRLS
jgi:hypothetical protein